MAPPKAAPAVDPAMIASAVRRELAIGARRDAAKATLRSARIDQAKRHAL